jgi:hypothetical protein
VTEDRSSIAAWIRGMLRERGPMPRAQTNTIVDFIRIGEALDLVAADTTVDPEWDAVDEATQDRAAGVMWAAAFQAIGDGATVREAAGKITAALREFLRTKGDGNAQPEV